MGRIGFEDLPLEIKMHIVSMLDYKDLSSCCQVCRDLKDICSCDSLWRPLCSKYWASEGLVKMSKQAFFRQMFFTKGRYIDIYRQVSDVWTRIKKHLHNINPQIISTLKPGLMDEEMDLWEKHMGVSIPTDLRCILTFHNGQALYHTVASKIIPSWFFGKLKSYNYESNFSFNGLQLNHLYNKWFVLLSGKLGGHSLLCYLGDVNPASSNHSIDQPSDHHPFNHIKLKRGNIIAICSNNDSTYFFEAKSPLDFFTEFADDLDKHKMPIHDALLYRFWGDVKSECTTRSVSIRVYTSYLFELSSRHCHVFAYLVEFKMDKDAAEDEACKLETRMWEVESQKGGKNRVEGEGVIGEYPVFRAGTHYTYISCTNIFDSAASMRGHYTVRNLFTNNRYRLQIPEFHMEIPDLKDDL